MTRLSAPWMDDARTRSVMQLLTGAGFQAWFVGGCVRDALLGKPVFDIDITTDALPEQVVKLAQSAGFKSVPTGIEHGTVTVVIEGLPHEITTFRHDVETDGRRATVAYSTEIAEDAERRDLTINAIYADQDGQINDPVGHGIDDLRAGRVRFIGDAEQRIKEDYLRILRFFRFYAHYGDQTQGIDPDGLAAISSNLAGLETLSAERVGSEFRKLLAAPNPAPALASMAACGALAAILPGAEVTSIAPLVHLEEGLAPNPIRRLAALGGDGVPHRLRLSRAEAKSLTHLREQIGEPTGPAELAYRFGTDVAKDVLLLRSAMLDQPLSPDLETDLAAGAQSRFPISATDLMPDYTGAALGEALRELETAWITSGFSLDRAALLSQLNDRKSRDNS